MKDNRRKKIYMALGGVAIVAMMGISLVSIRGCTRSDVATPTEATATDAVSEVTTVVNKTTEVVTTEKSKSNNKKGGSMSRSRKITTLRRVRQKRNQLTIIQRHQVQLNTQETLKSLQLRDRLITMVEAQESHLRRMTVREMVVGRKNQKQHRLLQLLKSLITLMISLLSMFIHGKSLQKSILL